MDLFEYQGKRLFAEAGLPVAASWLAREPAEARRVAEREAMPLAVKAQVLSGGRGKAGGIAVVRSADECEAEARRILGLTIRGKPVSAVLIERGVDIAHEFYLAITLSRRERCPLLLFSDRGGVDVEEVGRSAPASLLRTPIDPLVGLLDYQIRDVVAAAGLRGKDPGWARPADTAEGRVGASPSAELDAQLRTVVRGLWALYRDRDATLAEVNPLVVTRGGDVICLDSKVTIDDDALYRQDDLASLSKEGLASPSKPDDRRERRAVEMGITYVSLGGDVGVIGNGAGLVMSTLDLIEAAGGRAADFCDVGGGAQAAAFEAALRIIFADARVRAVLVNIFGGITRGDEVARGLLSALQGAGMRPSTAPGGATQAPVIVRLAGNGAAEGRALLAAAGLPGVEAVDDVDSAVARVVALAGLAARGSEVDGPETHRR
jgi:succinyl-CoA synthetase beta subunit